MNILQINASINGERSHSSRLSDLLVDKLRRVNAGSSLTRRDLVQTPAPVLDSTALQALFTPDGQRDAAQRDTVAGFDRLIDEIQRADRIVLGVPMYNFGIPVQLKAWLDAVARAGVTFRYTADGPQGLLNGKKVYSALAFGGRHKDTPNDLVTPYLQTMLGFLGLTDLTFVYAEGLAMGEESLNAALRDAQAEIAALAL
ncbi:FMN-dependent NADH-azoreductase [Methylomonas sp. HYX-M1]|uniref:FMN-dependent NADH-azoreductase n=1 Tax=Methylomonas sp. HYX-M1 TaxID=3139307 RepID=UPI00345B80BF